METSKILCERLSEAGLMWDHCAMKVQKGRRMGKKEEVRSSDPTAT